MKRTSRIGSHEQLQMLVLAEAMSGVGHWRYRLDPHSMIWSDEVYRIHGLSPETFDPSGGGVIATYHPDDQPVVRNLIEQTIRTGEGFKFQLRLVRPGGEERTVCVHAEAQRNAAGTVAALFGVIQDVTVHEALLRKARRSEARYRLLADNMGDVICRVRPTGKAKYISPAVKDLLGYAPREMGGRSVLDFVHPEDRTRVQAIIAKGMAGERSQRLEHRTIHQDGRTIWVESRFQAVADERGGVRELVAVIRDASARKALEDNLMQALERAEAGAQAKSEFLANMSHELRTPLTSVIGFSGMLQASTALPEMERLYADRIATASEALLSVINDILDYSKLEAGAVEMDPQPFDPRAMVDGAVSLIEAQRTSKGLALTVEVDDAVPAQLMGDEGRLRQVLLNFLANAVKFTASGGITLKVGSPAAADGRRWLRVAVSDTGIGVSADKLAALFERFTQADSSTTRTYGGTGLGLAISRRLIDLMGGVVGAESRPGAGSTFWFEAPLPEVSDAPAAVEAPVMSALRPARILAADDAPANRELVTAILQSMGMDVETVCDGAEAVEAVMRGGFDLVLMDVHMPGMDGLEATRAIRQRGGPISRTPILALTANVQAEHVARCLEAGMDGHVAKPINLAVLATAMGQWLGQESMSSQQEALSA